MASSEDELTLEDIAKLVEKLPEKLQNKLLPKDAIELCNEMKDTQVTDVKIRQESNDVFNATVTIKSKTYEGCGSSKESAKRDACEKAFHVIMHDKLSELEKMATSENNVMEVDPTLVNQLASFALYKLFETWKREGYFESDKSDEDQPVQYKKGRLDDNLFLHHPNMVLNFMRSDVEYTVNKRASQPEFTDAYIKVGDQVFWGDGKSRKLAKHNAAIKACNTRFGTNY